MGTDKEVQASNLVDARTYEEGTPYFAFDYLDILFPFFYIQPVPNQVLITLLHSMKKQMMESVKIFREDGAENAGRGRRPGIKESEGAELSITQYGYSIVAIKGLRT